MLLKKKNTWIILQMAMKKVAQASKKVPNIHSSVVEIKMKKGLDDP